MSSEPPSADQFAEQFGDKPVCKNWESALKELHAAIERGGLDISCCMDCGAPVVCIPDGLPMCDGCTIKAIETGKGLPELTDAERAKMNAMPANLVEQLWNKEVDNDQPFTVDWLCEIGGQLAGDAVFFESPDGTQFDYWSTTKRWTLGGATLGRKITTRGDVLKWIDVLGIVPKVPA